MFSENGVRALWFVFERDEVDHKTAVYVLFYVIPSKIWKKNLLLQIKGLHCRNSEELQKPFKYFAIFYSVEKKYAAAQIVQSIIFELLCVGNN